MIIRIAIASAFVALTLFQSSGQMLTGFGASATNGGSWTYTPATSALSGTEGLGDLIYGAPDTVDITGSTALSLTANATTAPTGSFNVILEDTVFRAAGTTFFWSDFTGGNTVQATFSHVDVGFDFANLSGWSLVSGGSDQAINVSLTKLVAVVPEPSTAAFGAVLVLFGLAVLARRHMRFSSVSKIF